MQARRAQGLCYFCDDKYTSGHKCNLPKQLFILDLDFGEDLNHEVDIVRIDKEGKEEWTATGEDTRMILLCALSGIKGAQKIHVI